MFYKGFSDLNNRSGGFTLIELLVVISIISVLSTIVLSSLNSARTKARNTQVQQEVGSWMNAINLYKNDTGNYPLHGTVWDTYAVCLGGNYIVCNDNSYPGMTNADNNLFKSQVSKYINTNNNPNRKPLNGGFVSFYEAGYNGGDYYVLLYYYLEGNQNCSQSDYTNYMAGVNVTECISEIDTLI